MEQNYNGRNISADGRQCDDRSDSNVVPVMPSLAKFQRKW